jgi:hypothetical protein
MQPDVSIELIAMLSIIACFLAITTFRFGRLSLRPLYDARLSPSPPTQFMLTDIYALLGQVMFAGLLLRTFQGDGYGADRFKPIWAAIITSLLVFWWIVGVRWLSQAGVQHAMRRLEVLAIAVPAAFGGPLAFLFLMIFVFIADGPQIRNPNVPLTVAEHFRMWTLIGGVLVIFYMYFSGCAKIAERSLQSRD